MTMKRAVVFASLLFLACILVWPSLSSAATQRVGTVTKIEGPAFVTRQGQNRALRLRLGAPIHLYDRVKSERNAKVRITFIDQSIISVGSSSALIINEYVFRPQQQERSSGLRLLWGKVKCYVNDFTGYRNRKFNVSTNTSIVGVRGTVFLVWIVDNQITRVASFKNEVEVRGVFDTSQFVVVEPNMITDILAGQTPGKPVLMTAEQLQELQDGLLNEDQVDMSGQQTTPATQETGEETTGTTSSSSSSSSSSTNTTTTTTSTTTSTSTTTTTTTTNPVLPLPPTVPSQVPARTPLPQWPGEPQ